MLVYLVNNSPYWWKVQQIFTALFALYQFATIEPYPLDIRFTFPFDLNPRCSPSSKVVTPGRTLSRLSICSISIKEAYRWTSWKLDRLQLHCTNWEKINEVDETFYNLNLEQQTFIEKNKSPWHNSRNQIDNISC